MKKIIGCILLVIPLACANPSHTDSPNHMHHTALAASYDKQEEDSNADTISAKIARHAGFTSTGKVKAVDYADLYFSSQELIAHFYVKTGQRVRKGDFQHSDFTSMIRNKFHLKFSDHSISPELDAFLKRNRHLAESILNADRLIVIFTLLSHTETFTMTYDNMIFLINRIEMMDAELRKLEPGHVNGMLNAFLRS